MGDTRFPENITEELVFDPRDTTTLAGGFEPGPTQNTDPWIVFQIVFYVFVIILGVLGNSLILHVYSIKSGNNSTNKTTTSTLVKVLAVSDLFVCLFRFRNLAFLHAAATQGTVSPAILYFEVPDKIAIATTVVVTGVIAFDRYDCVCRPYKRFLTHKRTLVAAVGCVVLSVITNVPLVVEISLPSDYSPLFVVFLKTLFQVTTFLTSFMLIIVCYSKVYYRIRQHVRVGVGVVEVRPRVSPGGSNRGQRKVGERVVSTITSAYPTRGTDLTVMNLSTVAGSSASDFGAAILPDPVTVHQGNGPMESPDRPSRPAKYATVAWAASTEDGDQGRRANDAVETNRNDGKRNGQSLQRKTTRMLFLTSVVFILTWLPQGVYAGTALTGGDAGQTDTPPVSADAVFYLKPILFMNNVVNPLIYGIANRRFRKDCIDVLRKIIHY